MVKGSTEFHPGQCYARAGNVQVPVELYHPMAILSILNVLIVLFVRVWFDFVFFDTNTVQSYNTHLSVRGQMFAAIGALPLGLVERSAICVTHPALPQPPLLENRAGH